jgi:hypothetical protein
MTDAEIAGYMDWRGPGAYTERQLRRIRSIVEEVQRRERERAALKTEQLGMVGYGTLAIAAAIRKGDQP